MQIGELLQQMEKGVSYYHKAIISAVLDAPRTDLRSTDYVSDADAQLCIDIARGYRSSTLMSCSAEGARDYHKIFDLAYERGKTRFMDLPIMVTKDVMAPPPFILEPWIEKTIEISGDAKNILEIGTGSGAPAIALAKYSRAQVLATDVSDAALAVAKQNAKLNNVDIEFIKSDLFENIGDRFDVIASDPPCSKSGAIDELESNGGAFCPRVACDGGKDGLRLFRSIIQNSPKHLKEGGLLSLCLPPWQHVVDNVPELVVDNDAFSCAHVMADKHGQTCAVFARTLD